MAAHSRGLVNVRFHGHPNAVSDQDMDAAMARGWLQAELERIRQRGQAGERLRMDESVPAAFRKTR